MGGPLHLGSNRNGEGVGHGPDRAQRQGRDRSEHGLSWPGRRMRARPSSTGPALGRRRLSGLPAVFLVAAVAGVAQSFGRFAFGVLLPAIRSDLGLSNTVGGSLGTANVAAY